MSDHATATQSRHWTEDDRAIQSEHGDVVSLLARHRSQPEVPGALDRRIKRLAREHSGERLSSHWIFGQGPRVALVALILFSIAILVLWMR